MRQRPFLDRRFGTEFRCTPSTTTGHQLIQKQNPDRVTSYRAAYKGREHARVSPSISHLSPSDHRTPASSIHLVSFSTMLATIGDVKDKSFDYIVCGEFPCYLSCCSSSDLCR